MQIALRFAVTLTILIGSVTRLAADSCGGDVTFKLYGDYTIVAQGSVPGLSRPLNLIIDTGAVPTVLDTRSARRLRLKGRAEKLSIFNQTLDTYRVTLPGLSLGPIRTGAISVLVEDLASFGRQMGARIDGMIGLDVLSTCDFTIDYDTALISFGTTSDGWNLDSEPDEFTAPFELAPGYAVVRLNVRGQPIRLMVDTGAKSLVLFAPRVSSLLQGLRPLMERRIGNLGGNVALTEIGLSEAYLGSMPLRDKRAALMEGDAPPTVELDGLLGVRWLGARRFGFDFARRTIHWTR